MMSSGWSVLVVVLTVLNTAPAPDALQSALWALTDVLIANELEAAMLAGQPANTDPAQLGLMLLARVRLAVVITLGEQGAALFQKNAEPLYCPALPVVVTDSTGAGDAFTGAFVTSWAAADEPRTALLRGICAGSLACTNRGVVPALAHAKDIDQAISVLLTRS